MSKFRSIVNKTHLEVIHSVVALVSQYYAKTKNQAQYKTINVLFFVLHHNTTVTFIYIYIYIYILYIYIYIWIALYLALYYKFITQREYFILLLLYIVHSFI